MCEGESEKEREREREREIESVSSLLKEPYFTRTQPNTKTNTYEHTRIDTHEHKPKHTPKIHSVKQHTKYTHSRRATRILGVPQLATPYNTLSLAYTQTHTHKHTPAKIMSIPGICISPFALEKKLWGKQGKERRDCVCVCANVVARGGGGGG